jgi:hypothetical protein
MTFTTADGRVFRVLNFAVIKLSAANRDVVRANAEMELPPTQWPVIGSVMDGVLDTSGIRRTGVKATVLSQEIRADGPLSFNALLSWAEPQ